MVQQASLQTSPTERVLQTVRLLHSLLPLSHSPRVSAECSSQDVQSKVLWSYYFLQFYISALGFSGNVRPDSFDHSQPQGGEDVREPAGQPRDVGQPHPGPPPGHHDVLPRLRHRELRPQSHPEVRTASVFLFVKVLYSRFSL